MDLAPLRTWNTHWGGRPVTSRVLKDSRQRAFLARWVEDILHPTDGLWQVKAGPRQIGKTTSLGHVARTLIEKHGVDPARITIAVMDDEDILAATGGRIEPIIEVARQRGAATPEMPAVVLVDEIQELSDWPKQLKVAWDKHHAEVRLLGTGSATGQLLRPERADFDGRVRTVTVHQMKFREVLDSHPQCADGPMRDALDAAKRVLPNVRAGLAAGHEEAGDALTEAYEQIGADDLRTLVENHFLRFLAWGGFPSTRSGSGMPPPARLDRLEGAFNTIVARDVAPHGLRLPRMFRAVARRIALHPGGKLEPYGLGKDLGVSGDVVRSWVDMLEGVLFAQGLEALKTDFRPARSNPKMYVTDPAWTSLFRGFTEVSLEPDDPLVGPIVENVLVDHVRRLRFNVAHTTALPIGYVHRPEVDVVVRLGAHWFLMESKYSHRTRSHLASIGPQDAVRVVATRSAFEVRPAGEPHDLPAWFLALLC